MNKTLRRQLIRHPLAHKSFQQTLRALSWFAPNQVAGLLEKRVNAPHFWPLREKQKKYLDSLIKMEFPIADKKIVGWATGVNPQVLFVHGWSGRGVQFQRLAEELQKNQIPALLLDLPAHGESEGQQTHLFEAAQVLHELNAQLPSLNAIVAHSFGAAATAFYLHHYEDKMKIEKVVFLAPLTDVKHGLRHTALANGIPASLLDLILLRAEERHNFCWENLTPAALVPNNPRPLLILHDQNDPDLGIEHSTQLQLHWPEAKLVLTQNLGHIKILRDPTVIHLVKDFLKNQPQQVQKVENF